MLVHVYTDDDEIVPDVPTLISTLDVSDPLHLHPNDSVALTVVSVKLKGTENYQVWSCAMLLALEGKNKIGFIDDSIAAISAFPYATHPPTLHPTHTPPPHQPL
ncbi:ribonuclease H-like domain-containing protein [Tanacetum coccineum]|uniref:Ribonuclease H-like domain-containing protein n=1 Tax=Tanacetum coccineum TaxID=301880 RepID=A0ABQ4YLG7_9ASTR